MRRGSRGAYRLVRTPPARVDPPPLDAAQRSVVEHGSGPLLVLAGPGTGKTTTLVESVAARIARGGDPERILVLTFSRKAAVELRDRMALRIGAARAPQATTFHSFCYALVRAHQDSDLFTEPLRLLSGPEQDVTVRELLAGQVDLERLGLSHVRWPDDLRACLTTRGFADEVRAVLARSRELGLDPGALDAFARRIGRPDWRAASAFLAEYLDVLDLQGVIDYAELVHRAVLLARRPETAGQLADRYDAVYVDEYQDTDPAQVRLLHALASGGRTLVAFGDPDQSIYAFRGADVGGILEFPHAFPRADGRPAPVRVLRTSRRSGAALLEATRRITRRMPLPRLPAEKVRLHREPAPVREGGRVEVYTYPTAGTELDNIADILRRAHLEDGVPWNDMAVLVRAGARTLPVVRRALTSAGVPVDVDGDDLPLRHEPAVAPLLTALRAVAKAEEERRPGGESDVDAGSGPGEADAGAAPGGDAPCWLDTETALTLLASPSPAWTRPTCGGSGARCARRSGRPGTPCPRPRTSCSPARWPSPSGSPCTTPSTRAVRNASAPCCAAPASAWPAAARPRRPSGSCGTARPGHSAWNAPPAAAAPLAATPTATSTPCAPCSPPPRARRSARAGAAPSTSSRRSRPRTSPPTPSPAAPRAPTSYA